MKAQLDNLITQAIQNNTGRSLQTALKRIQWKFVNAQGQSIKLDGSLNAVFCDFSEGITYDGRDNQALKLSYFTALMREKLEIVLINS